jgi:hypothetical protein
MNNLIQTTLAKLFKTVDPIQARIANSERDILEHQDSMEYHTLMVEWHAKRLVRLRGEAETRKG